MKKKLLSILFLAYATICFAQTGDSTFKGTLTNDEYNVYLKINFYEQDIKVPGQEIFGEMAGFFGDYKDGRKWLITDVKISGKTAALSITNDYGSEDLTAELTQDCDGKYTLRQLKGSNIKIARNRKWIKIPKSLVFIKKN